MAELAADTPAILQLTPQWIAVYKPAGWLSIAPTPPRAGAAPNPTEGAAVAPAPVLAEWLRERMPEALVVHRLDRETSGVILFARSADAHRLANGWFQSHEVKKTYDLLAFGEPKAPVLRINHAIGGAASLTQVEVKESFREGFLAQARPVTGRRHQIRIHLSMEGHPLWGDPAYRGPREIAFERDSLAVDRVALHSARIALPTREVFESYWPLDFKAWVEALRTRGTRD